MKHYRFNKLVMRVLTLLTLAFSAIEIIPVHAATTWTVSTTADDETVADPCTQPSSCSLRTAITAASDGDTIIFASILSGQTIYLDSSLTIAQDITIDGSALASKITISGDTDNNGIGDGRVFTIDTESTAIFDSLVITRGKSPAFGGGGILNNGTLTVQNSTVSTSSATGNGGGGILNWGGMLTVTNSTFSNNSAGHGGGIVNHNGMLTVTNCIFNSNSATGSSSGGAIHNTGPLTITNSTFSANTAGSSGGAINSSDVMTITNSTFSGNSANIGGGVKNNGELTVVNSTFSNNSASLAGGGIDNVGTLTVTNSTFYKNAAGSNGGAIYTNDTLTLTNSTISGNSAAQKGGGIYNWITSMSITNSTLSGNFALTGGNIYNDGTLNYANTIVSNSTSGGDCIHGGGSNGINISNLVEDGSCSATLSGPPRIVVIADNGGPTQTMALRPDSPAIDAGDDATCASSPVNSLDQRGVARPIGTHCDIGAYEGNISTAKGTFKSIASHDGWILETTETSNKGKLTDSTATLLYIGDNAQDKQYRSILSFNTSNLPDEAVVITVKLKIKVQGFTGGNMFTPTKTLGNLLVDIRQPYFGANANLVANDFQAGANENNVGILASVTNAGWHTITLKIPAYEHINLTNKTQFRLRFTKDDNDDLAADYLKIFSGNAPAASRPQLIVEYYIP